MFYCINYFDNRSTVIRVNKLIIYVNHHSFCIRFVNYIYALLINYVNRLMFHHILYTINHIQSLHIMFTVYIFNIQITQSYTFRSLVYSLINHCEQLNKLIYMSFVRCVCIPIYHMLVNRITYVYMYVFSFTALLNK